MTPGNRRRPAAVALALMLALSIVAFAAVPASAAPASARPASAAPANARVASVAPGGRGAAPTKGAVQRFELRVPVTPSYAVICYVYINPTPYETGTGFTGYTENIDGSTTCTKPVTYLRMTIYLFMNGMAWGFDSVTGTQYITGTAKGPCVSNSSFYGEVNVEIIWPAGVTGPPSYTTTSRSFTTVSCF